MVRFAERMIYEALYKQVFFIFHCSFLGRRSAAMLAYVFTHGHGERNTCFTRMGQKVMS